MTHYDSPSYKAPNVEAADPDIPRLRDLQWLPLFTAFLHFIIYKVLVCPTSAS